MHYLLKNIVLLLSIFVVPFCISSGEYCAEAISRNTGFYQGAVNCALYDSRGFIWLGTSNGLFRYDGKESVSFKNIRKNASSLASNFVLGLTEDKQGYIWVSNESGSISRLNPKTGKFRRYILFDDENTMLNMNVVRPFCDSLGTVWYSGWQILKQKYFLCYFDTAKDRFVEYDFYNQYVDSAYQMGGYQPRFMAGPGGDIILKNKVFRSSLKFDTSKTDPPKYCFLVFNKQKKSNRLIQFYKQYEFEKMIANDSHGNILIEVSTKEEPFLVLKLNPISGEYSETNYAIDKRWEKEGFMFTSSFFDDQMFMTVKINDGRKEKKHKNLIGVHRFNDSNFLPFDSSCKIHSFSSYKMMKFFYYANKFFSNGNNIIWDVYCDDLVKIYKKKKNIRKIKIPKNIIGNDNHLNFIYQDSENLIWLGTYNGLYKLLPEGKFKHYYYKLSNMENRKNRITGITESDKNTFIVSTLNSLLYFNKKTGVFSEFNKKHGYEQYDEIHLNTYMLSVLKIKDTVWSGTTWGLNKFVLGDKRFKMFLPSSKGEQAISSRTVGKLYLDKKGNLWIASSRGLNRYLPDKGTFKVYLHDTANKNSICGNQITALTEDKNGNLWVASYSAGLNKYNPEKDNFSRITSSDGLPDDEISSIVCDNENNLWLGSKSGLIKYNQGKNSFFKFSESDGLAGNDLYADCAVLCNDGKLLFGGENGLTLINPYELKLNTNKPTVAVSKLFLNDSLISYYLKDGDTISKKWNSDYLKIQFSAFDYIDPSRNQYAFRIDGIHKDWIYLGNQNSIILSGIEPGDYKLRIKASNNDGVWNEKGISIHLSIIPPFWMKAWFKVLILLVSIAVIILAVYSVFKRKQNKELTKRRMVYLQLKALQSQINPHFIFNSLNSILSLIVNDEKKQAMDYLSKFSKLLRMVIERSRNTSISLDQEIELIELYFELESLRFDNKFNYSIKIDENIKAESTQVPPLFLQPYIENSIKHGKIQFNEKGKVEVLIKEDGTNLKILIIDNGIGRKKATESASGEIISHKSYGMEISRERLSMIDSQVSIKDLIDEKGDSGGTQVEIIINNYKKNYGLN